jgi:TonB family protein
MKTLLFGTSMAFAVAMCLIRSTSLRAIQETGPNTARSAAGESYPNTADGLHSLLTDLLAVAKGDDEGKFWSKIAEMEIPDYENWFTRTYGREKGQVLADAYGKSLKLSEQQFEMLWMELAKQEGEITINRLDVANRRFDLAKKDDSLANPTDEFKADWKKTGTSAGPARQAIGYFCFVDGKFRLKNFPHEVQILSTTKPGPVVAAKLINRVQPVYPEAARKLRLRGMVSVNVVIHKDGMVTVQNVGAGHPLLAPPAVAAVQQWKYEPTTVSGEPVDVQMKVYVTFEFSQQPSEQKQ